MKIIHNQFVHGGNIYRYDAQARRHLMDFSANINPFGPSPRGIAALDSWVEMVQHYPEPYQDSLRRHLAQYYGVDEGNIAVGNGATEFLYTMFLCLCPPRIWTVAPTFSEYARAGRAAGSQIISAMREDLARRADKHLSRHDAVCLCIPNNPDGFVMSPAEVDWWIEITRQRGAYLVIDESFGDFDEHFVSYRSYVEREQHLFVLQSLTKFWAIPGLRLGALFADAKRIGALLEKTDQWNVNVLAAAYMEAALYDTEYISATRRLIGMEKERMYRQYSQVHGLGITRPTVNFMLIELPNGISGQDVTRRLEEKKILIRNCDNYDGLSPRHIRIAIRGGEENDRLFAELTAELSELLKEGMI